MSELLALGVVLMLVLAVAVSAVSVAGCSATGAVERVQHAVAEALHQEMHGAAGGGDCI